MAYFSATVDSEFPVGYDGAAYWGSNATGYNVYSSNFWSDDTFFSNVLGNDTFWGQEGNDRLTFMNGGNDTAYAGGGNDIVQFFTNGNAYGSEGNDYFLGGGSSYSYNFYGDEGNDTLVGQGGAAVSFSGGAGDDTLLYSGYTSQSVSLQGGGGNDYLQSDWSAQMTGGIGADIFYLGRAEYTTAHTIADFKDGLDKIAFNQAFGTLSIRQSGSSTVIRSSLSGSVLAQLQNTQASAITSDDFLRMQPRSL